MKAKQIPDSVEHVVQEDPLLKTYQQSMQQEVYQFAIPDFFLGMSFKDYSLFLQLCAVKVDQEDGNLDRKCTIIGVETRVTQQTLYTQNDYSHFEQQQMHTNAINVEEEEKSKDRVNHSVQKY